MTEGTAPVVKTIQFGGHYAEDGNTWIGPPMGAWIEVDAGGAVSICAGGRHESYAHTLSPVELAGLLKFLSEL